MEYKVHIDPGKEDCYWQYVHPGATIYINMQVLKGGDGNAGMGVRNPANEIIHNYSWKQNDEYEETSEAGGYYSVCLDNQFSRFAGKLVNLYITTFRGTIMEKYTAETEELDIGVNNFTESIKNVDQKIHMMLQYQSYSRAREGRDYQLLLENNSYIQYWSIAQCLAIVIASMIQLFSVKKFFTVDASTKSGIKA
ncbi:UNVERIFIED_CONTAM: hypothetical protein GTU68_000207 [Idotea baltica]|nr:hypothetical protein [Idotea baltica]